jgi:predicted CopG family antitoxin
MVPDTTITIEEGVRNALRRYKSDEGLTYTEAVRELLEKAERSGAHDATVRIEEHLAPPDMESRKSTPFTSSLIVKMTATRKNCYSDCAKW